MEIAGFEAFSCNVDLTFILAYDSIWPLMSPSSMAQLCVNIFTRFLLWWNTFCDIVKSHVDKDTNRQIECLHPIACSAVLLCTVIAPTSHHRGGPSEWFDTGSYFCRLFLTLSGCRWFSQRETASWRLHWQVHGTPRVESTERQWSCSQTKN